MTGIALSPIAGTEPTVKQNYSLKQSTITNLQSYQALYKSQHNVEVSLKDVVEQMLVDFMKKDTSFQKHLKANAKV